MRLWGLLTVFLSINVFAMGQQEIRDRGEEFCFEYIESLAMGSFHVLDCVNFVRSSTMTHDESVQGFIEKLCNEAPSFYGLDGVITNEACMNAARNLSYF